ncbi:MAG: Uma2 family endonuclease [Coleofasciculaceae cyanobacterium]
MSVAQDRETPDAALEADELEDVIFPPGDLYSDEPPLETELHLRQLILLIQCLEWWWRDRQDFYAFGNLTIYYSPRQRKSEKFRGPDFFVVLGTQRKPRKSWVVWQEDGKYPNVIVEVLSPKTAKTDRGLKKQLYQDTFRTPDYFWFDPHTLEFQGFHLVDGRYQELVPNEQGWLWSEQLGLWLGVEASMLRWFTQQGQLIPTPEEAVEQERQLKEQERQLKEQERQLKEQERQLKEQEQQRAERLAEKLRELGIDPADL